MYYFLWKYLKTKDAAERVFLQLDPNKFLEIMEDKVVEIPKIPMIFNSITMAILGNPVLMAEK